MEDREGLQSNWDAIPWVKRSYIIVISNITIEVSIF